MTGPDPGQIGRLLMLLGGVLVVLGGLLILLGRFGLFHLPGDLVWRWRHGRVYAPIASCLVLSAVLTLILWLIHWFRR